MQVTLTTECVKDNMLDDDEMCAEQAIITQTF